MGVGLGCGDGRGDLGHWERWTLKPYDKRLDHTYNTAKIVRWKKVSFSLKKEKKNECCWLFVVHYHRHHHLLFLSSSFFFLLNLLEIKVIKGSTLLDITFMQLLVRSG